MASRLSVASDRPGRALAARAPALTFTAKLADRDRALYRIEGGTVNRSARLDLIAFLADSLELCAPGETGADLATRAYQQQCVDKALGELIGLVTWELKTPCTEIAEPAAPRRPKLYLVSPRVVSTDELSLARATDGT